MELTESVLNVNVSNILINFKVEPGQRLLFFSLIVKGITEVKIGV